MLPTAPDGRKSTSRWAEQTLGLTLRQQLLLRDVLSQPKLLGDVSTTPVSLNGLMVFDTMLSNPIVLLRILVSQPSVVQDRLLRRCHHEIRVKVRNGQIDAWLVTSFLSVLVSVIVMHDDTTLVVSLCDRDALVPTLELFAPEVLLSVDQFLASSLQLFLPQPLFLYNLFDPLIVNPRRFRLEIAIFKSALKARVLLVCVE